MTPRISAFVCAALLICGSGCALPWNRRAASEVQHASFNIKAQSDAAKTIHVVGHGWHTGLVLAVDDVSEDAWPEIREFSGLGFVEIGWGDNG